MHKTNNDSRRINDIVSNNDNGYIARFRRLKIQEGILSSNVNKTHNECRDVCDGNNEFKTNKDFKKYLNKLKDSYIEMKNLYEDIKVKTDFHETLEITDINDLKRDILELDEKIKSFKHFIRKELNILQLEVTVLTEKSNDNNYKEKKYMGHPKIPTKKYKDIVPSPVRVLIKSPFKCSEIQQFQDFMKNSPNRCGGWNEYNHNLFVQIWNKYNGDVVFISKVTEEKQQFQEFKDEVLQKIAGIGTGDVNSHSEWYSRYVELKMYQKRALDKWKENKMKIKKPLRESKTMQNIHSAISSPSGLSSGNHNESKLISFNKLNSESFTNIEESLPRKLDICRLMRPTTQWIKRCEKDENMSGFECNIESISKLRVPTWRFNLEEKKN